MAAFQPVELYVSDIHGEYGEFAHILRSGCGEVRRAAQAAFEGALSPAELDELSTVVCYPREKAALMMDGGANAADAADAEWAERMIDRLATLLAYVAGPEAVDGLELPDGDAEALCELAGRIRVAVTGRLHVVGDIYDRGPSPDLIMDELSRFVSEHAAARAAEQDPAAPAVLDIEWGNHDILWMGAAAGQPGCVAAVVRICARYGNLAVLEENYGMDLAPLRAFAQRVYGDDPCAGFGVKGDPSVSAEELLDSARIQKAIAYIQFKEDAAIIDRNPGFGLADRKLLHHVDREARTCTVDGIAYALKDPLFPTIDPADPYTLTPDETAVLDHLVREFTGCARLQEHMRLFLDYGSLYRICGDTLLFHACVPLENDGSLKQVELFGQTVAGRALFDTVDALVRAAFAAPAEGDAGSQAAEAAEARTRGLDLIWYLWLGQGSPLFAKSKMATFEIYQIAEKEARTEKKNAFYALLEDEAALAGIFREFGMDPARSRIVCGHVPVKVKDGEDPVKCGGKAIIIDGGMSIPYQASSGIAGFTLLARAGSEPDADELQLAAHERFCGRDAAIRDNAQLRSTWRIL